MRNYPRNDFALLKSPLFTSTSDDGDDDFPLHTLLLYGGGNERMGFSAGISIFLSEGMENTTRRDTKETKWEKEASTMYS